MEGRMAKASLNVESEKKYSSSFVLEEKDQGVAKIVADPANDIIAIGFDHGKLVILSYETGGLRNTLEGHTGHINDIVILDAQHIATGSYDRTIRIWNLQTNECEKTLKGHTHFICGMTLSAQGELVSTSYDKTIRFWNIKTGECRLILPGYNPQPNYYSLANLLVSLVSYFPPSHSFLTYITGYMLLKEYDDAPLKVALAKNGDIVCGSSDAVISVFDGKHGNCKKEVKAGEKPKWTSGIDWFGTNRQDIRNLAFTSEGNIISASSDGTIRIWDQDTLSCQLKMECTHRSETFGTYGFHKQFTEIYEPISAIGVIDDYIVSLSSERLRIWDSKNGKCCKTITDVNFAHHLSATPEGYIFLCQVSSSQYAMNNTLHRLLLTDILKLEAKSITFEAFIASNQQALFTKRY